MKEEKNKEVTAYYIDESDKVKSDLSKISNFQRNQSNFLKSIRDKIEKIERPKK